MNRIFESPDRYAGLLSVEEYHGLGEFNENGKRTELIRGVVVEKMSKSPLHAAISRRLFKLVLRVLPEGYSALKEDPLTFRDSEPEPDLSIVRGEETDFGTAHPPTAALVVEVAMTSVALDHALATLYAEAGVEEYWIVLANERAVEIYRRPVGGVYQEKSVVKGATTVASAAVPGVTFSLDELFH